MRNSHFRTLNIARKLTKVENVTHTLQVLEYGERTEIVEYGEKLKTLENETQTLYDL